LLQLILYALFAAGLAFAGWKFWDGFTGQYVAQGAAAQMAADKPIVEAANARADEAEKRAERAQEDLARAKVASDRQNAAIASSKAVSEQSRALSEKLSGMYSAEVAKGQEKNKALYALTTAEPKTGQSCEDMLSATDRILRDSARARSVK